jgi:hypothetical protein
LTSKSLSVNFSIVSKIKDVTMIDDVNYESFQVLRYENGQFYNVRCRICAVMQYCFIMH